MTRILFVEQPGPWGHDALIDNRMDPDVRSDLLGISDEKDTKVFLARRGDRRTLSTTRRLWNMERVGNRVHAARWSQPVHDVVRWRDPGTAATDPAVADPVLFICTNGARDRCCAVLGRQIIPDSPGAWEVSHIGGHRFAPTALRFPEGLLLGRLTTDGARECLTQGGPPARFLRGRFGRTAWQQVAEAAVADLTGLPLTGLDASGEPADTVVAGPDDSTWQVELAERPLPSRRSSCEKQPVAESTWQVIGISRKR